MVWETGVDVCLFVGLAVASPIDSLCPDVGEPTLKDDEDGERGDLEKILDVEIGMPLGVPAAPLPALMGFLETFVIGKRLDPAVEGNVCWLRAADMLAVR